MKTHITKDGNRMYISQMEDIHLLNTVNLKLNNLDKAKKALLVKGNLFLDNINGMIYSEESAEAYIETFIESFSEYILEVVIRGLDISDIRSRYIELIERSIAVPNDNIVLLSGVEE